MNRNVEKALQLHFIRKYSENESVTLGSEALKKSRHINIIQII